MADLTISVDIDAKGTKNGADQAKRAVKSIGDEAQNTARNTQSLARVDFSGAISKLREYGSQIQSVGQRLMGFGQQLTLGLTLPIAAVTTLGLKFNATKEQALVSFGVLLKSGEKAKQLFSELSKFSADTPFEMPEIQTAAKSLLAFGVAQEQVLPTLTRIGDIASGINVPMTELAEIYGKAKTQGRLFADDINQLTGRGIPIIQELAKQFGVSEDKVKGLVESGKIGFPQLEKAFADMTGEGGQFAGMMAAQSKTFSGQMSTLADAANTTLGQLTEPLFNLIKENLPAVIAVLTQLGTGFNDLSPVIKNIILAILAFAAALGPALIIIGGIITAIGTLVGAFASIASGIAAIGGLSVALPIIAGVVAAISGLVIGIGLAVGVVWQLIEAWQNGFGPVASVVAIAVGGILTAISPILGLPILIGAVLATIYGIWTTNFGGIRDVVATVVGEVTTLVNNFITQISPYIVDGVRFIQQKFAEYWNKFAPVVADSSNQIRTFLFETWTEISAFLQENLAGITEYFRENWDSIRDAIGRVMDVIVLAIRVGVNAIRLLWAEHGETIKSIAGSVWNIVKTIVTSAVTQIGNVIKLIAQVINRDWSGAWQTFKNIVSVAISGLAQIVGSALNIVWQIIKSIVSRIFASLRDMVGQSVSIGRYLIEGLISGIGTTAGALYTKIKEVAAGALNTLKSFWGVQSPAKEFIKASEFAGEGIIVGFKNKADGVKNAAKNLAKDALGELRKEFAKAKKEFDNLLGSSFEKQGLIVQTADFQTAKSNLETLIKLRAETGLNVGQPLPPTLPQINAEIEAINKQIQGRDEATRMLEEYTQAVKTNGVELTFLQKVEELLNDPTRAVLIDNVTASKLREAASDRDRLESAKRLEDFKKSVESSSLNEQFSLSEQNRLMQDQIRLGRELTAVEKARISQEFDLAKLEISDSFQKLTPEQQEALREFIKLQTELTLALIQDSEVLKQTVDANKAYSDVLGDLNGKSAEYKDQLDLLNGVTTEANLLSEESRIRKLLEADSNIILDETQQKILINRAREVDEMRRQVEAAQKAKQEYETIASEISGSLMRIFQAGIKDGFKGFLRQMLDELKNFGLKMLDNVMKNLADRLSKWLTDSLFGGGSSGGGGGFGSILKGLFGGGGNGSSSGGGIFDSIKKFFNFGKSGSSSSGGSSSFGSLIDQAKNALNIGSGSGANAHEAIHSGGGSSGGGKLAGGFALAGMGANIVGGLIGGRVGSFISSAGTGLGIGAQIGSMIAPGIGTVVGAVIGAVGGGLLSLLGGDPKRKIDKKENMPKLSQGFADALKALRDLAADKNALYNDPSGVLAKANEIKASIASGFGIQFQSGHYRKIAKQQIDAKLIEADVIIKQIQGMGDEAKQALETDRRLETSFAKGVYMSPSFLRQFGQFKRRNGMLGGNFNGIDTLPSMLAQGEMVLNPYQINAVRRNAGFDVFQGAGIPNYAGGTYVQPPSFAPSSTTSSGASSPQTSFQPNITIVIEGEGITDAHIKGVFVDSLEQTDVQVKIGKAADRGKSRTRT